MKVVLGMSGGVDSTVAAVYLKSMGHDVTGVSLVISDFSDTEEAQRAADEVGIPFVKLDVREEFEKCVVSKFLHDYSSGRTPNPCTVCNPCVKFAALCRYAEENSFNAVSTGHYCKVGYDDIEKRYYISRATDLKKDQSYMLWGLTQKQLSMLFFPLSDVSKVNVRDLASKRNLSAAFSRDSQEICFIPDGHYADFIENRTGEFPKGDFIGPDGNVVGHHNGIIRYTIGQRKHLGISLGRPVFVSKIDVEKNLIYLSDAGENFFSSMIVDELNFQKLSVSEMCFRALDELDREVASTLHDVFEKKYDGASVACVSEVYVKVRYAAQPVLCNVYIIREDEEYSAYVVFSDVVKAVTPGQSAVFYNGTGDLLFGGVIVSGSLSSDHI